MRKVIIDRLMKYITERKQLDEDSKAIIRYGLENTYILITKSIIIFTIAYFLGIFKEMLIFLLLFNVIRTYAHGLHASKSYICLIASALCFLGLSYISKIITIPDMLKFVLGISLILLIYKNSPADTHKKPIVSKKLRKSLKIKSTVVSTIFVILSFFTSNFISNCLLLSLLLEAIFISPLTYKIFKLPYNNYLTYLEKEETHVLS